MPAITTIKVTFHDADHNWSVDVNGEHYQNCWTLVEVKAVLAARPVVLVGGLEVCMMEFDVSERPKLRAAVNVLFPMAK